MSDTFSRAFCIGKKLPGINGLVQLFSPCVLFYFFSSVHDSISLGNNTRRRRRYPYTVVNFIFIIATIRENILYERHLIQPFTDYAFYLYRINSIVRSSESVEFVLRTYVYLRRRCFSGFFTAGR